MLAQLVVYCGYRGFGSAQVHRGGLPTYLPTTHICGLRTFVAFKPQPYQGGPTDLVIYGR